MPTDRQAIMVISRVYPWKHCDSNNCDNRGICLGNNCQLNFLISSTSSTGCVVCWYYTEVKEGGRSGIKDCEWHYMGNRWTQGKRHYLELTWSGKQPVFMCLLCTPKECLVHFLSNAIPYWRWSSCTGLKRSTSRAHPSHKSWAAVLT